MMRRYREAALISDRALSIYPDNLDARFARAVLDKIGKPTPAPTRAWLTNFAGEILSP